MIVLQPAGIVQTKLLAYCIVRINNHIQSLTFSVSLLTVIIIWCNVTAENTTSRIFSSVINTII